MDIKDVLAGNIRLPKGLIVTKDDGKKVVASDKEVSLSNIDILRINEYCNNIYGQIPDIIGCPKELKVGNYLVFNDYTDGIFSANWVKGSIFKIVSFKPLVSCVDCVGIVKDHPCERKEISLNLFTLIDEITNDLMWHVYDETQMKKWADGYNRLLIENYSEI